MKDVLSLSRICVTKQRLDIVYPLALYTVRRRPELYIYIYICCIFALSIVSNLVSVLNVS